VTGPPTYWPFRAGQVFPSDPFVTEQRADCPAYANDYTCVRNIGHVAPHVAIASARLFMPAVTTCLVAAVWDDVWYADTSVSCPIQEVSRS
jgi:hypothetical protein